MGIRSFTPQVTACPGCGRTTSTFFQEMAEQIQSYLREQMPSWKGRYVGVEEMKLAVMGCVVNGPGESKHANIGISLPGTFEEPKAPVYVDGRLFTTLKGDRMVANHRDSRRVRRLHYAGGSHREGVSPGSPLPVHPIARPSSQTQDGRESYCPAVSTVPEPGTGESAKAAARRNSNAHGGGRRQIEHQRVGRGGATGIIGIAVSGVNHGHGACVTHADVNQRTVSDAEVKTRKRVEPGV